eukprot:2379263-Rhodomonas_salina.1
MACGGGRMLVEEEMERGEGGEAREVAAYALARRCPVLTSRMLLPEQAGYSGSIGSKRAAPLPAGWRYHCDTPPLPSEVCGDAEMAAPSDGHVSLVRISELERLGRAVDFEVVTEVEP